MKRPFLISALCWVALNSCFGVFTSVCCLAEDQKQGTFITPNPPRAYSDGRPNPAYRLEAVDSGRLLRHGDGPEDCDINGMREASLIEHDGTYHLYYDGCGPKGWVACLATSTDLLHWTKHGPKLTLGEPGEADSGTATSPWLIRDTEGTWHMFYVSCQTTTPPPFLVPAVPYTASKARSDSPAGPWEKQKETIPFRPTPGTYNSDTANPGFIVKKEDEYLMFYSAAVSGPFKRTLALARTHDLNGTWQVAPEPLFSLDEQIENSSLYFEPTNQTWFLFTNHIGINEQGVEYTDAIWVYWSKNLEHWDANHKAVVLDGHNCVWSNACLGMPSVIRKGDRLALFYDAPGGDSIDHMKRDIGLAWLPLPLVPPKD
ncbi:MAG: hypothetical protein FWH27_02305 [Planctomycetaceae bacterium]|nr:hypothetical protein [Planctomycetaceae bacterium]